MEAPGNLGRALGLEAEAVQENVVHFELLALETSAAGEGLSEEAARGLRVQLLEHTLRWTAGHLWQRGCWDLHISRLHPASWHGGGGASTQRRGAGAAAGQGGRAAPDQQGAAEAAPDLWGSMAFGDNVEDEWFVVWLLLELTRAFPVTARVWDNDGEFLLIEAAYSLPRWLKPESAANRVWLHGGALHIVPLPRFSGDPLLPAAPTPRQAVRLVRVGEVGTQAGPKVLAPILQRLEGFPGRLQQEQHSVRVVVPARVAHLLRQEPALLAPAVEAFHYRDVDSMRAAARMAVFPPQGMVALRPSFTRCLYAQLALQEFHALRAYPMPPPDAPQYKAAELGMKLTAGFEMLVAGGSGQEPGEDEADAPPPEAPGEDGREGEADWRGYLAALECTGFFEGYPPGTTQHSVLLGKATELYGRVQAYRRRIAQLAAPGALAEQILQEPLDPLESYPPLEQLPPDDSEAWLREGGAELEAELQRRQWEFDQDAQRRGRDTGGRGGAEGMPGFDPEALASSLRQFVEAAAGLEGAELPSGAGGAGAGAGAGAALDEARFAAELERALGLQPGALGDVDSDAGSESSEEGSSFYTDSAGSNSEGEDEAEAPGSEPWRSPSRQRAAAAARSKGTGGVAGGGCQPPPPQASQQEQQAEAAVTGGGAPGGTEVEQRCSAVEDQWEAATATDSDDEGGATGPSSPAPEEDEEKGGEEGFMDAYSRAMQAQLAPTTLGRSFVRAGSQAAPAEGAGQAAAAAAGEDLRPVDIDLNVVEGLLASYHEQQGLPGPAGNLAGLLGVALPQARPPPQGSSQP